MMFKFICFNFFIQTDSHLSDKMGDFVLQMGFRGDF